MWDAARAGRNRRWSEADWQAVEQWLAQPRRYSAAQLSRKLASERQVQLGAEQVRRTLKKNYRWKRIRKAPALTPNSAVFQAKQLDLKLTRAVGRDG